MQARRSGEAPAKPSVGIVTRTRNRPLLLRRALSSVASQTYPEWHLVIVNDGGARGLVDDLVAELHPGDPRIHVIHRPQSTGMEAASNAGLAELETDLAVIHDDDDSWAPTMLEASVRTLRDLTTRFPSVRGVVTHVTAVFETVAGDTVIVDWAAPWHADLEAPMDAGPVELSELMVRNLFPPIAFVFDRRAALAVGAFDETLPVLGDWDFHMRFAVAHDVWVHPEPLAFYHLRPDAGGALGNTVIAERDTHSIYRRHLENVWLRRAMGADGAASAVAIQLRAAHASRMWRVDMSNAPPMAEAAEMGKVAVPKRGRMRSALSKVNRWRKRQTIGNA